MKTSKIEITGSVDKPVIALILSFMAGVFGLVGGLFRTMFGFFGSSMFVQFGSMGEFMKSSRSFGSMMNGPWSTALGAVGLFSASVIIFGAFMLDYRVEKTRTWAILILTSSFVSIIGGSVSGLHVGSILGIVGGAIAFFWRSRAPENIA